MIGNCCHDFGVYYGLGYEMTLLLKLLSRVRKLIKQQKQLSKNANDLTPRTRPLWHCKWAPWRFFFFPDFSADALRRFLGRKIEMTLATLLCSRNTASADLAKQFFFTLQVRWWNLSWNHFVIITTVLTKDHLLLQSVSSKSMRKTMFW